MIPAPLLFFIPTGMLAGLVVLAAQADPFVLFLNYGVIGAIVVMAAMGWISFKPHVDALNKRIDAQAQIITEFQISSRTSASSMGRTADVLEAIPTQDALSVDEMKRLVARLEELAGPPDRGRG